MEHRAEGADDEIGRLLEREFAHVADTQLQVDARADRTRARATSSIAVETSIPITRRPVRSAIGIATRPVPTASSTTGPSASSASET
jgi:hypothetical protein